MTTNVQRSNSTTTVPTTVDLKISDFLVKSISKSERGVAEVNSFFNSTQIKSELHWFTHRDTVERAVSRPDRRLFYFAPHGVIIGGLMIWCESRVLDPLQAQIRLVAVSPDYREYGIGQYLVKKAIEFAKEHDKKYMIADVAAEAPAVNFWKTIGFHKADSYFTDGGREMFRMERQLSE